MRRRDFIRFLGSAAAAWPLAARAQQPRMRVIGFLGAATASSWSPWTATFERRLGELGWINGHNVQIDFRWAEGRSDRYAEIAAEFVRLKVDVIVTAGGAVTAAKQATSEIPIVFALAVDPLGSGLIASLSRPGANTTGLSMESTDLAGKRVELMRELTPGLGRLAIMANVDYPAARQELVDARLAAQSLSIETSSVEIRQGNDIAPAFEIIKGRAEALYVCTDALLFANRNRINDLAMAARLPTVHAFREYVEAGGLISYGPNIPRQFRRAAELVDKILHGTRPSDIPVEQPTRFEFVINLKTARVLGLTIPSTLLTTADEVIE